MTLDPVMHALLDLCQAIGNHPSPQIHTAYDNALRVIREHTGFVPGFSSCHPPEARAFTKIGILNRGRTGAAHFIQEVFSIPLPLHGTLDVYMRSEPQGQK